tara:strand:- start:656 stop:1144 length:489 start_codon:yes stop_codon:yes gene_type:complete
MKSSVLNVNSSSLALPPSKGLVKIESKLVAFTASSANIDSGALSVPGNSIITKLTAVVHTALAHASATVGVSVGTAAGGTQFTGTLDADGLEASGTAVAAGVGASTDDVLTAALGGTAILGTFAASYRAADTDVHFRTVASTGAFTAGKMCYIIEYIELSNN